jgi:hypothetical protein
MHMGHGLRTRALTGKHRHQSYLPTGPATCLATGRSPVSAVPCTAAVLDSDTRGSCATDVGNRPSFSGTGIPRVPAPKLPSLPYAISGCWLAYATLPILLPRARPLLPPTKALGSIPRRGFPTPRVATASPGGVVRGADAGARTMPPLLPLGSRAATFFLFRLFAFDRAFATP